MADEPHTIAQTAGRVANGIVSGFAGAPALLLIVVINVTMIIATAYYLSAQETNRAATIGQVTDLLKLCFGRLPEPNHRPE